VYRDNLVRGENVRKDMVDSSRRKSGKKKSSLKRLGAGGMGGYILVRTIKSKGSSKIIAAEAAPAKALSKETSSPCFLVSNTMMMNVTTALTSVTGLIGLGAVYDL
jgi:hypothetical protein